MSTIYTNAVFKQFEDEVLGLASCHLKKEGKNEASVIYRVADLEERQNFIVSWNEADQKVCCLCHSFECRRFHYFNVNNSVRSVSELSVSANHGFNDVEVVKPSSSVAKLSNRKKTYKKRKVQTELDGTVIRLQDSCQQMELMKSRAHEIDNCHVPQQESERVI
ncbi:unnamed protein product [Malus baccata var. baccata]